MLEVMETLDDDCDARGVHFVKVSSPEAHEAFGVQKPPKLLYFKHDDDDNAPNVFEGQQNVTIVTYNHHFCRMMSDSFLLIFSRFLRNGN